MNTVLTINEVAQLLGVSTATVRNWIKNGTIRPVAGDKLRFDPKEIEMIRGALASGEGRLTSRRNKTLVKGNQLSKKYISSKSNYKIASGILDSLGEAVDEADVRVVLADYAYKLYLLREEKKVFPRSYLPDLLACPEQDPSISLIKDLIHGVEHIEEKARFLEETLGFIPDYEEEDFLGLLYMGLKTLSERKAAGTYFTPTGIVESMVEQLSEYGVQGKTIVDPCCGSGNFLMAAIKRGFPCESVFGMDFDDVSVALARINVSLLSKGTAERIRSNIICCDSLSFEGKEFDYCVGNPPWGSEVDTSSLASFRFECASGGQADAFALFLEKGMKLLSANGCLFFVVPESLLTVTIHGGIRKYLQENGSLKRLIFWGNAFEGVQAPSISICVKKGKTASFELGAIVKDGNRDFTIGLSRNFDWKGWPITISDSEFSVLNSLPTDTFTLKDHASFALGIVTGDNKKYVLEKPVEHSSVVVKGSDVFKYRIKPSGNYIVFKPELFQQVAKKEFYFAKEKLLYRFISDTLVFAYDDKQTLSLNSANILIPSISGYPMKYILAVLNSSFAHFYFQANFRSVKILRNHIESIPIPSSDPQHVNDIVALVDAVINAKTDSEIEDRYKQLDDAVLELYGFSESQIDSIRELKPKNLFLY